MKKICALRFLVIFIVSFNYAPIQAQNSGPNPQRAEYFNNYMEIQETARDSLAYLQERVLMHFANESLTKNEMLFFKAYVLAGIENRRSDLSGVLNVELLDNKGTVLQRQYHQVEDGMVNGQMDLPKNIVPGKYQVRAYTRWMKNFGQRSFANEPIWVGEISNTILRADQSEDIVIIPEGGNLLNGHKNKIIVKLPFQTGASPGEIGEIVDDSENKVSTIHYYSNGLATSIFEPVKNENYRLLLNNGKSYPLPAVMNEGFSLSVNNLESNRAKIRIITSGQAGVQQVTLKGTLDGITYLEKNLELTGQNVHNIEISKKDLPGGILRLSLVDQLGNELASRPLWIDGKQLNIEITPVSADNEENLFRVKVTDGEDRPVQTKVALSVNRYDSSEENENQKQFFEIADIFSLPATASWGEIPNERRNRFLKDLGVLVANYQVEGGYEDEKDRDIQYSVQKGLELTGYAYDLNNKLLANTKIQVIAQSEEEIWLNEMETNEDGLLDLRNIQVNGDAKLIFRTEGKKTTSRLVKIKPLDEPETQVTATVEENPRKKKERRTKRQPQQVMDTTGLIELDEVEINGQKSKEEQSISAQYGILTSPQRIKFQDPDRPKSLPELLSEMPGVVIRGIGTGEPRISIPRAWGPILWVLDGLPLIQPNTGQSIEAGINNPLFDVMTLVSDRDIDRVELLIGPEGAIFGSRASGGVVLIYTRSGNQKTISRKEGQIDFQGYETTIPFSVYQQSLSKRARDRSNILFWDSDLETDENGEATFRLPESVQGTSIKIDASTITQDGRIGSSTFVY